MVADDTNEIRMVLRDLLSIDKHEIVGEAVDGEEAVEQFTKIKPDILLLDLAMPKKDGVTVIKEIITNHPKAKIILVTATGNQNTINECMQAGASAYISKPFDMKTVLKVISDTVTK